MKFLKKTQKGLSLVEMLIAISIFTAAGLLATNILVNINRIQGRITLENAIYEDARFMMERISRAIRNNAIDYEEYFSRGLETNSVKNEIGAYFGCYAAQFYDPGIGAKNENPATNVSGLSNPGDLGAICVNSTPPGARYTGTGCTLFRPSVDKNTGSFPFIGYTKYQGLNLSGNQANSNAFCALLQNSSSHQDFWERDSSNGNPITCDGNEETYNMNKLFLISRDGTRKTIFASKTINSSPDENALAKIELVGEDENNDGITEKWQNCTSNQFCCANGYDCDLGTAGTETLDSDGLDGTTLSDRYKGFIPISPLRTNVKELRFQIRPVEDPHKAFAEGEIEQPRVTITLTVEPTEAMLSRYVNANRDLAPEITIQTTVSSRVLSEINSYRGPESNDACEDYLPYLP
ncbi:prepilin-type N-terminal cleavage/methylation domain-containing protein [Candidatus Peregrinibacteria bacterium]|nr:prepilin-type N-terminal cleavage/methylation domain-containing protein [Candidatus Peregrinibacteria bacterium]